MGINNLTTLIRTHNIKPLLVKPQELHDMITLNQSDIVQLILDTSNFAHPMWTEINRKLLTLEDIKQKRLPDRSQVLSLWSQKIADFARQFTKMPGFGLVCVFDGEYGQEDQTLIKQELPKIKNKIVEAYTNPKLNIHDQDDIIELEMNKVISLTRPSTNDYKFLFEYMRNEFECIKAPKVADHLIASYVKLGKAHVVLSKDSDFPAYNCQYTVHNFAFGRFVLYVLSKIMDVLKITSHKQFLELCILLGGDLSDRDEKSPYPMTEALRLIREFKSLDSFRDIKIRNKKYQEYIKRCYQNYYLKNASEIINCASKTWNK